jgi:hypothetical protein
MSRAQRGTACERVNTVPFLTMSELLSVRGAVGMPAPSTIMSIGIQVMSLLDHPKKVWDDVRNTLHVFPDTGKPGQVYTPAKMKPDGSIAPAYFSNPPQPGPQAPTTP